MAKKSLKKLKEYPVPTDRHALIIVNPWGVPTGGFTRCSPQQWRGFHNNLASWVECACGISPTGMWRTSEGGREQVLVDMPFGGNALTTIIPGTNDRQLTELGRRLLGAHHASRFFRCPRAIDAWQGHVVSVYEYDWKTWGDPDQKFDHFIQDTPTLTDEFVCRRGDSYPLPDAPLSRTARWSLRLPSTDAWGTAAPVNAFCNDAPVVVTSTSLPQFSLVASPSPTPEPRIKRDPYEEEDELMQHVKHEIEGSPVKFEDPVNGMHFKEEDNVSQTRIKRDPYEEEDEQMDEVRDLERSRELEEKRRVERWQPYETPLLPEMRQQDEEPIRVKQESGVPGQVPGRRVDLPCAKQEEQSRLLDNEEASRRILADLLRIQREETERREAQSSQALQQVKLEPVDNELVPKGAGRSCEEQEFRRERERSQTLPSNPLPSRVKQEPDDGRRSMTRAPLTSQVDDFLSSCLPGKREETDQRRRIDDDTARWGDWERQRLIGDRYERQRDCRVDDIQRRNNEQRREGERRHDKDRRRDEYRPTVSVKREPVDQSFNDDRTRDPRRAYGATVNPRIRIKREMDEGSAPSLSGRSDQWKRVKREG